MSGICNSIFCRKPNVKTRSLVISSPEPKAHRCAYSIPMVRRPSASVFRSSIRRRPQCKNIFFSETAWPIKAKFYVEPPWVGGTKFCSRHLGHMTKMAATPIYGNQRTNGPVNAHLISWPSTYKTWKIYG